MSSLGLWFYAIGKLPLATAVTLNYMSPIWMVVLLIGASAFRNPGNSEKVDARLICTVLIGFAGVICVLEPTMERDQLWGGLMGLLSVYLRLWRICMWLRLAEPVNRKIAWYFISLGSHCRGRAGNNARR